jgi:hypothetical protein
MDLEDVFEFIELIVLSPQIFSNVHLKGLPDKKTPLSICMEQRGSGGLMYHVASSSLPCLPWYGFDPI